ncbi:hypothetical protein ERX37_09675 [Macrococcus hajekii]|uniref:DUF2187 domain-containing protein n=1 Tax=Macrococcus hajekii TaxID=198482 RepID=A0A4R6BIH7_9STAP|nr:hypothetical protein [Macrococcus hajekii]TDM01370.1 hypothetical protein ERX37_09675 [Macrococcus hajekii]GGB11032.1 hypothetical protein GCM10007190_18940 [Macrococcus hajekii]
MFEDYIVQALEENKSVIINMVKDNHVLSIKQFVEESDDILVLVDVYNDVQMIMKHNISSVKISH